METTIRENKQRNYKTETIKEYLNVSIDAIDLYGELKNVSENLIILAQDADFDTKSLARNLYYIETLCNLFLLTAIENEENVIKALQEYCEC